MTFRLGGTYALPLNVQESDLLLQGAYKSQQINMPNVQTTENTFPATFQSLMLGVGGRFPVPTAWCDPWCTDNTGKGTLSVTALFNFRLASTITLPFAGDAVKSSQDTEIQLSVDYKIHQALQVRLLAEWFTLSASTVSQRSMDLSAFHLVPSVSYAF